MTYTTTPIPTNTSISPTTSTSPTTSSAPTPTTYTASDFYNSELDRLNQKQQNSDIITNSNERLAGLNNSYRKRYAKYVEMLMVLVLSYMIYLGVVILQKNVPSISIYIVDYITIFLIFAVFIYLFSAFWQLSSRSVLNYDELDLSAYDASGVDVSVLKDDGQLFASQGNENTVCVGDECCPPGLSYDSNLNMCGSVKPTAATAATTAATTATTAATAAATTTAAAAAAAKAKEDAAAEAEKKAKEEVNNRLGLSSFTTLEYSKIENAYTDLEFNNPVLKREPNANKVIPFQDITKLNVSNFR